MESYSTAILAIWLPQMTNPPVLNVYASLYCTLEEVSGAGMFYKFIWKHLTPLKPFPVVAASWVPVVA